MTAIKISFQMAREVEEEEIVKTGFSACRIMIIDLTTNSAKI